MQSRSEIRGVASVSALRVCFTVSALVSASALAQGADPGIDKPANKLTLGIYHFSNTGNATDINVRHTDSFGDTWLGYYHSSKRDEHQGRAGWDNTFGVDPVRITPSAQIASGGYVNGSVNLETSYRRFPDSHAALCSCCERGAFYSSRQQCCRRNTGR